MNYEGNKCHLLPSQWVCYMILSFLNFDCLVTGVRKPRYINLQRKTKRPPKRRRLVLKEKSHHHHHHSHTTTSINYADTSFYTCTTDTIDTYIYVYDYTYAVTYTRTSYFTPPPPLAPIPLSLSTLSCALYIHTYMYADTQDQPSTTSTTQRHYSCHARLHYGNTSNGCSNNCTIALITKQIKNCHHTLQVCTFLQKKEIATKIKDHLAIREIS